MRSFGLIGFPLGHSFSATYFSKKFERENIRAVYRAFELEQVCNINALVKQHNLAGFNVTIPHKETIINQLQRLNKAANIIGAVNCVQVSGNDLVGHNTDWVGFKQSLERKLKHNNYSALIFGGGGSSKAVQYALGKLGINFEVISRQGSHTYADLTDELIEQNKILVNTTPVGMWPDIKSKIDIPYRAINSAHVVFDLIYNPCQSQFLLEASKRGALTINGLEMLEIQAKESWEIWNMNSAPLVEFPKN